MVEFRRRLTADRLSQLAAALSPREHQLLDTLAKLRAATTDQLARVVFPTELASERLARRHLQRLAAVGLVRRFPDRSRDRQVGAPGYVHALTAAGLRLAGGQYGLGTRQRRAWRPTASFLAHRLAISELFARLAQQEADGGPAIREFQSEPDCWRRFTGAASQRLELHPDAFLRLGLGDDENLWFVEIDRGTETRPSTILAKCQLYVAYERSGQAQRQLGIFPAVAFIASTEARAAWLRQVIGRQPAHLGSLFVAVAEKRALEALIELEVSS